MGFAAGLKAGSDVAQGILDAYYASAERKDIQDLDKQKPKSYEIADPDRKKYIQGIQDATDAEGNRQFQFIDTGTPGKVQLSIYDPTGEYASRTGSTPYVPTESGAYAGRERGLYTPIQGSELDVAPRVQTRTSYLGRDYGVAGPTPEEQRAARTQALADIISKYRPAEGVRLGIESQKGMDEAEARQYAIRQRPLSERKTLADIKAAEAQALSEEARAKANQRTERIAQTSEDFDAAEAKYREANPKATPADLIAFANRSGLNRQQLLDYSNRLVGVGKNELAQKELKEGLAFHDYMAEFAKKPDQDPYALAAKLQLSPDNYKKVFQSMTGATDAQVAEAQSKINAAVSKARTLDDILKAHKDDKLIDPNSHYVRGTDDKGNLTLTMVNTATGQPTGQPLTFKSDLDAFEYLTNAAKSPQALFEYVRNSRQLQIDQDLKIAQTGGADAQAKLARAHADALPAQSALWGSQNDLLKKQIASFDKDKELTRGLSEAQLDALKKANTLADLKITDFPADSKARRELEAAHAEYWRAGAKAASATKASNMIPLVSQVDGSTTLVDVTKLPTNANGTLALPVGFKQLEKLTDVEKVGFEAFAKAMAANPDLTPNQVDALKKSFAIERLFPGSGPPGGGAWKNSNAANKNAASGAGVSNQQQVRNPAVQSGGLTLTPGQYGQASGVSGNAVPYGSRSPVGNTGLGFTPYSPVTNSAETQRAQDLYRTLRGGGGVPASTSPQGLAPIPYTPGIGEEEDSNSFMYR